MSTAEKLLGKGRVLGGRVPAVPNILFVFVLIAAMANILFGFENSIVASAVNDFMGELASTDKANQGLLKGFLALGATVVCPFAGFLQDYFG